MDKVEFKIQNRLNDDYQSKSVTILINGQDIIELLKNYELPFAKKEGSKNIAGGYDGLSPDMLFKYLTKPEEFDIDKNGKITILDCECGCEGCWPMKIKVMDIENKITWTEFEQSHRSIDSHNFWDYANFGQFSFDKNNYNEQLDKLNRQTITYQRSSKKKHWL